MALKHLSYSCISMLLRCPRSWRYKYLDQKPMAMNANLIVGGCYHKTLAYAYNQKLAGNTLAEGEIDDVFSSFWEQSLVQNKTIEWIGWKPDKLRDRGIAMSRIYINKTMPNYDPVEVEAYREIFIEGVKIPIIGYLDLITKDLIVDHKWRAKDFSELELERDIQSTIYSMMAGIQNIEFHEALNQRLLGIEIKPVHRGNNNVRWVEDLIREVWAQMQTGVFPPNPTSYLCSLEYCSYFTECRMSWL